jgi:hypothetical protein
MGVVGCTEVNPQASGLQRGLIGQEKPIGNMGITQPIQLPCVDISAGYCVKAEDSWKRFDLYAFRQPNTHYSLVFEN